MMIQSLFIDILTGLGAARRSSIAVMPTCRSGVSGSACAWGPPRSGHRDDHSYE